MPSPDPDLALTISPPRPPLPSSCPQVQAQLPMLLMGGSALAGAALSLLLPETLGSALPDRIQDVQTLKTNSKPLCACISPKAT